MYICIYRYIKIIIIIIIIIIIRYKKVYYKI